MVDPLEPAGALGVAVDQDEPVDHGGTAVAEADQDVGPKTNPEANAVRNPVIMQHVFNLKVTTTAELS